MWAVDVTPFAEMNNVSIEAGVTLEFAREYLRFRCQWWISPQSVTLCEEFLVGLYDLATAPHDKERARRLIHFSGIACVRVTSRHL